MVKGDPTMIFSVVLSKMAGPVMTLRQGGYPCAIGSSCWLIIPYRLLVVPVLLDEYSKGIPFLFKDKKVKGNLIIGMPKGQVSSSNSPLRP